MPRGRARLPRRRVHVVGVVRPEHLRTVARLRRELDALAATTSRCTSSRPRPDAGKWANINAALAAAPVGDADWLLIVDDDVILPRGFLDRFLAAAEAFGLELAQPAHAFASHAAWDVTRRRPGALARRTRFVEIGPVTALSAAAARELLPFPDLRMGWGLDGAWSALAARARLADRDRRRHARPPPAPRRRAPTRATPRWPRPRPSSPTAPTSPATRPETLAEYRAAVTVRVAVVAEYYPRAADPALGVWAHRQALATRDAGADIEVFVLHRPVPSKAALRARDAEGGSSQPLLQPLRTELDGLKVTYVPFVAPPRPRSYASWGAWAAPTLALALRNRFDLVHAHYAVPAGDAARRQRAPLVISVHGGDVLGVAERFKGGREAVTRAFEAATLTLANSTAIADRSRALGARDVRVVHLGTDVPARTTRGTHLVTVGNLIARKRHADVLHALTQLPDAR